MGRFRDLWASGRFAIKQKQEDVGQQEHEALDMIHELQPDYAVSDASKVILDALKSRRGQETGRWLKALVPESEVVGAPQAVQAAPTTSASVYDEMTEWIDALFKQFTELVFEFNKQAVGTDLMISYERAKLYEKKSDEVWYKPVTKTYQGRLTTRQWALVVRGRDAKISIYLFPAEMVLAFNADQVSDEEQAPFMEVVRGEVNGVDTWTIGGERAPLEAIPHLAKELMGDLIRVSTGAMSETELFTAHTDAPHKLGENVAVGYDHAAAVASAPTAAQAHAASPGAKANFDEMNVFDACDIVDGIIERELKRLYDEASSLGPGSPQADLARKQISTVEAFRMKMLEAFEEFTTKTQALLVADQTKREQVARK
jgi:hypothetical protein